MVLIEPDLIGMVVLGVKLAQVGGGPQPRCQFQTLPRRRPLAFTSGTLQLEGADNLGLAQQLGVAGKGAVGCAKIAAAVAFQQAVSAHILYNIRVVGEVVGQAEQVAVAP